MTNSRRKGHQFEGTFRELPLPQGSIQMNEGGNYA